jgi:NAD(P)-dependent dehydrogenase (short-subunit alcohol dehydrogenase family)
MTDYDGGRPPKPPGPAGLLTGKRALVTGGSRGLGRALCATFAAEGARVAFTYTRSGADAAETARAIESAGGEALSFQVANTDSAGTEAMVRSLEKAWGGVDILVNNAGISQTLPLPLIDEADFDQVMSVNVKGAFLTAKAVLRGMIRRKSGVILNMGSLLGMRAVDAPVHYAASKAAVHGLTLAMSKEVARHNIRVLCLAPGLLDDGMGKNLPEHRLADFLRHNSLRRAGTLEEVAHFTAFLVSDRSSYITGETILMDGGL